MIASCGTGMSIYDTLDGERLLILDECMSLFVSHHRFLNSWSMLSLIGLRLFPFDLRNDSCN